jgi:hypothetical protein
MMKIFLKNEKEDFGSTIPEDLRAKEAMIPKIKAITKKGIFSIRHFRSNFRSSRVSHRNNTKGRVTAMDFDKRDKRKRNNERT